MRPWTFAKNHPVAVVTNMAIGMIAGPWVLGQVRRFTGVSVSVPTIGGGGE